jgi:hypothetical protein
MSFNNEVGNPTIFLLFQEMACSVNNSSLPREKIFRSYHTKPQLFKRSLPFIYTVHVHIHGLYKLFFIGNYITGLLIKNTKNWYLMCTFHTAPYTCNNYYAIYRIRKPKSYFQEACVSSWYQVVRTDCWPTQPLLQLFRKPLPANDHPTIPTNLNIIM